MINDSLVNELIDIIRDEFLYGSELVIDASTTLTEIGVDSIALMQLLVYIEEHFGFEFSAGINLREGITTVGSLAQLILVEKDNQVTAR